MLTLKSKHLRIHRYAGAFIHNNSPNGLDGSLARLNKLLNWLIIPLLGLAIPNITGLFNSAYVSYPVAILNNALFVGIALIIYKGNMFFLKTIRLGTNYNGIPYKKTVTIYFMVNIVYSGIISLASLSVWNNYANSGPPFGKPVIIATLAILVCVLFINNLYELLYLKAERDVSVKKMHLLEEARMQAELQSLNSEIDPHFMYNALSSLSYLLKQNPNEADKYNAMLASLYRYVLKNKYCPFVTLAAEMDFCRDYFAVQQLRFGHCVLLQVVSGHYNLHHLKVPPLSIQTLVENALKHNNFSEEQPLIVQVHISDQQIQVKNSIQKKPYEETSNGTGLKNLQQRLKLLVKQPMQVEQSENEFVVTIPVSKL